MLVVVESIESIHAYDHFQQRSKNGVYIGMYTLKYFFSESTSNNKNEGGLYNATEDMQTATDSYLSHHQDYVAIPGLLALWIGSHGVCNLHSL